MPLPKPREGQSKNDFISSSIDSEVMKKEFPDRKQRLAVCYELWEEYSVEKLTKQLEK